MANTDIYSKLDGLDQQAAGATPQQNAQSIVAGDVPWATAQTQQEIVGRLNLWSTAAPALKADMLLQFAEAGVAPTDPVGQWVIRTGVPALGGRNPDGTPNADANNAAKVLATPGILFQLAHLPLDQMTNALKQRASDVGSYDEGQLKHYLESGSPNVHHSFWNKIGDVATTGVRDTLTGLQSGYEAVQGGVRAQAGGLAQSVSDIAHGELPTAHKNMAGLPNGPADYKLSVPNVMHFLPTPELHLNKHGLTATPDNSAASLNSDWHFGSGDQLTDPGQITAVQALRGNDLGGGFFPGGAAKEQATLAQQAAATINGHALTPGRALAAFVTQAGTRPYSLMSGIVDSTVALNGDFGAIVLHELSNTAKAARLFSPTSEEAITATAQHLADHAVNSQQVGALSTWAGEAPAGGGMMEAITNKLRTDPGSLQELKTYGIATDAEIAHAIASPHAGMFDGLRQAVSPKDALTWLNGKAGKQYADWAAGHDFTDIWNKAGQKMPSDVAAQLADATTPDEVRSILGRELGTTVRGVPETALPYAWRRPFETVRWGHYMPTGSVDVENGDNAVQQALRTMQAAKVPREHWDDILKPIATASNQPEMFDAYVHGLGNRVKQTLIDRGVESGLAKTLTRYFPDDWEEERKFFVDEVGNTPHMPGMYIGGEDITHPINPADIPPGGLYHGTSTPWAGHRVDAVPSFGSRQGVNLFGSGLYVTDNPEVAVNYTRKGAERGSVAGMQGAVYKIAGAENLKFLDARSAATDEIRAAFARGGGDYGDYAEGNTVGELYESLREGLRDEGMSASNTAEYFDSVNANLERLGYDGLTHPGGARTGNKLVHNATVIFDPAKVSVESVHTPRFETTAPGPVPIDGPHLPSELLNRSIPPLDMRSINRQVGLWGKAYNTPVLKDLLKTTTYLSDAVTVAFKVGTLLKLALPARFLADEQARMATADLDSMFHNPLSYIAYVMGGKGSFDATGERFIDDLGDAQSTYRAAVGTTSKWKGDIFQPDQLFAKHRVTYDKGTSGYVRSWAAELSQLHIDPISREVARAIQNVDYAPAAYRDLVDGPRGLDAIKQSFWDGPLSKQRHELAAANLWGGTSSQLLHDRSAADAYIESVHDRVFIKTGGHDSLIDSVANGKPFKGGTIDKELPKQLEQLQDTVGPLSVKGQAAAAANGKPAVVRHVVDRLFSALMDTPTQTLTRSPAFRQAYWDRVGELAPYADQTTQDGLLRVARNSGINLTKPAEAQGVMGLEQLDQAAKAHALKTVRDLLYYPGERLGATDALRNVAPFGEAWRNVLTRWAGLAAENPAAIRRGQQGVTSLRDSGFFYKDPADGVEKFNIVPGNIMQHLAGVPFPLAAPVKGLNILGTGLPGVGPAVQIPAAMFHPQNSALQGLKDHLLPYGDPDYSGGTFELLFPGWLNKVKTTGWLTKVPFMGQSGNESRILDNLAKQVFQYKMSSGSYDISNPDVLNRLTKDSLADAKKLFFYRGMAQFAAPAAPAVIPQTQLKDGSLIETWKITDDYRKMIDAHAGDSYAATRDFVTKYGPNRVFATEPEARRVTFGVPTTAEGLVFKQQHNDFVSKFPTTYGYFVPQGGAFDYPAYLDAIQRGDVQPLNVSDWSKLADARLGNSIYDQARSRLPASPSQAQKDWLVQVKDQITKQYPGFNDDSLKVSKKTLPQSVEELRAALTDPTVKGTPLAEAASAYLTARDEALAAAQKRSGRSGTTLSGSRMDDLRQWLYEVGNAIAMQRPDFTNMWNSLFMNEVQPPAGS